MRHGSRILRCTLAISLLGAALAVPAHAYVYWTVGGPFSFGSNGGTALGRANLDGGGVTHAFATGLGNPAAIAVDAGHIYWINAGTFSIGRSNLDGSGANPTWIVPTAAPSGLALDATHVYWTDGSQWIGRANLDGTGPNSHYIKTTPAASGPLGIAVDGATIYFGAAGQIASVPVSGGIPSTLTLLPANTQANAMAVAGGYLYWSSLDFSDPAPASAIDRVQLGGTHPVNLGYVPSLWLPAAVASDGTYLYWADDDPSHVQIGRALIASGGGATNLNYSFISEPGGPTGVAVDAGIDVTQTSLSCTPSIVAPGSPMTCTATVADSGSGVSPTGTVNVTGNGAAFFSGNPCALTPTGTGNATCVVGAVPTTTGSQGLHAAYGGDAVHRPSSGDLTICAGTGCTPPPTPTPTPTPRPTPPCLVPNVKGKTLAQARVLLTTAHCALGKVTRPKARRGHRLRRLVVGAQSPGSGRRLRGGSKVSLRLVQAPRPPKRRH